MNQRRLILGLYLLLAAGLGLAGGYLFLDARHEYARLVQVENLNRQHLAEEQVRLEAQQKTLDRLRNDPDYVEQVIRRKLGYAKPDETVYRFED
ncbi:MAG TPA: septum formation initiator family protein [Opitutaceae bacterium]